jgi:hypothetical protein
MYLVEKSHQKEKNPVIAKCQRFKGRFSEIHA